MAESTVVRPAKELRDSIHGFIPVYKHELAIIDDPVFQRLRRIKQLSFGYLVYPGAEHSRFVHSLGVMHAVGRALGKIRENGKKYGTDASVEEDDIRVARLAALLHDVGHYPFSHALDRTSIIAENHEKYSTALVLGHFSQAIEKAGISPKDVANLIEGRLRPERSFLTALINSQIDADKFDYLLRDSYYAGVKYGVYDIDRLLDSLLVLDDRLVVLDKGRFTAEQFILARHHMFSQVYAHKTKQCFEAIARSALESLAEKGRFSYPETGDLYDASLASRFANMDDAWVLQQIRSLSGSDAHWRDAIENRKPFKMILDSAQMTHVDNDAQYLKAILEDLEFQLKEGGELDHSGVESRHVLLARGELLSYKLQPYGRSPEDAEEHTDPITIYNYKTGACAPIEELSGIIMSLGKRVSLGRVYADESMKKPLEEYLFKKYTGLREDS